MKIAGQDGQELIVIGENIHTTRALRRKSKRIVSDDGVEAVVYRGAGGEQRRLPIPESFKDSQDYRQGQIKHVMIALKLAMAGEGAEAEEGHAYLAQLVKRQQEAGADILDLNVDEISWKLDQQKAAMAWLVGAVQAMTDLPLSVDSSNVAVIRAGLEAYGAGKSRPLLNSASLERIDALELARDHGARVMVTAAGEKGMPESAAARVANASRMVEAARDKGFALTDIYIDPLIFPVSVDATYGLHSLEAIQRLREKYGPEVHISGGISNVSFGIPGRRLINEVFLILAVEAGADSGILDPVLSNPARIFALDRDSSTYRMAEDVLLGRDEYCRRYIRAWRKGELADPGTATT